jgi:hypothetical protein
MGESTRSAAGIALIRSGTPTATDGACASGSPSAPAVTARSAVTATVAARSVLTWSSRRWVPRLAASITRRNDSFPPPLTMITSSSPSLTSAAGAASVPAAK